MDTSTIVNILRELVLEHGTQAKLAADIGCSPVYLSDVIAGRRDPGKKILSYLGFEKVIDYKVVIKQ